MAASSRRSAATTRRPSPRRSRSTRSACATGSTAAPSRPTPCASCSRPRASSPPRPASPPCGRCASTSRTREPAVRELLEHRAQTLVDKPGQVRVEEFEEDAGTLVFELSVDDEDYGRVIGRGGRTAQALRTVVKAAAVKDNRRVLLDIVE